LFCNTFFPFVSQSPFQPFPLSTPQQFYQSLTPGKTKPAGPKFRKRMGRCGRVFIDRVGYKPISPSVEQSQGGKTRPSDPVFNRYQYDSDVSDDESTDEKEVDEMDSLYLKHRVQLLSETELRNLVTVPFLTPHNMININQARSAAAAVTAATNARPSATMTPPTAMARVPSQQQPSNSIPSPSPVNSVVGNSSAAISTTPIKRQNSRTKMTPQQAAVAMANGMIAANMAAVVNNTSGTNKAAMQMAMAAAQQQQQQKQMNSGKLTILSLI
jgi:hypothetical protein